MDVIDRVAALWWPWLGWTSLQTLLLAGLVGLLVRCLPRLAPATRCLLWWLVGLQVLAGLGWRQVLTWPTTVVDGWLEGLTRRADIAPWTGLRGLAEEAGPALASALHPLHLSRWLCLAWLLLVLARVLLAMRRAWQAIRRRGHAQPLQHELLRTLAAIQAQAMGLRRVPGLYLAPALERPMLSGLWRPVILLPVRPRLQPAEAAMAIAHELAHLRRGDPWLDPVPALASLLLGFHPALRWSRREYRLQRESACDALAMHYSQENPRAYGRLLLRFGADRDPPTGGGRDHRRHLQRRLRALHATPPHERPRRWQTVAAMLVTASLALPFRPGLADPPAAPVTAPLITTLPSPPAPPPPVQPAITPRVPLPPRILPPPAPLMPATTRSTAWAAFDGRTLYLQGEPGDAATLARAGQDGRPGLWFRRGHRVYVSHDRDLVRQLIATLPAASISRPASPGSAGSPQAISRRQWRNAMEQSELAARLAGLAARQAEARRAGIGRLWPYRPPLQPAPAASAALQAMWPSDSADIDVLRQRLRQLQQQMSALARQQQAMARPAGRIPDPARPLLDEAVRQGRAVPLAP